MQISFKWIIHWDIAHKNYVYGMWVNAMMQTRMCKKHELCAQQKQNKTEKMFMGCKFGLCIWKAKQNRKSTLWD